MVSWHKTKHKLKFSLLQMRLLVMFSVFISFFLFCMVLCFRAWGQVHVGIDLIQLDSSNHIATSKKKQSEQLHSTTLATASCASTTHTCSGNVKTFSKLLDGSHPMYISLYVLVCIYSGLCGRKEVVMPWRLSPDGSISSKAPNSCSIVLQFCSVMTD